MPENSAIETPHSSHSTHTCFFDFAKSYVLCNKKITTIANNKKVTVRRVRRATAQTGRDSRSFKPYYSHSTRTIRTTVTSFFSFSILASFGHLIAAVLLGPVQSCVHSLFELFTALAALKFCNPDNRRPHKTFDGRKPMEIYQQYKPEGVPPLISPRWAA